MRRVVSEPGASFLDTPGGFRYTVAPWMQCPLEPIQERGRHLAINIRPLTIRIGLEPDHDSG